MVIERQKNSSDQKSEKIGVLLLTLGTPDGPGYFPVRRFLKEFLSDRRVIEVPRLLWLPILWGPILTFRPLKSARAYAKIWDYERGCSPLRTYSQSQAEKLRGRVGADIEVAWAFRYGSPSTTDGIEELQAKGCSKILLLALYPQYSATTVASAYDHAFDTLKTMRWQPAIRTVTGYCQEPAFAKALARSIENSLASLDWQPEKLLASYHSVPQSYCDKGDPYYTQCLETSRMLNTALGTDDKFLETSFQSRVGATKWLGPYTDETVIQMAAQGVKKLAVVAPAFSADCLETLEEINMELRESFLEAGGTHFHYIPCLNDSELGMELIQDICRRELGGWL